VWRSRVWKSADRRRCSRTGSGRYPGCRPPDEREGRPGLFPSRWFLAGCRFLHELGGRLFAPGVWTTHTPDRSGEGQPRGGFSSGGVFAPVGGECVGLGIERSRRRRTGSLGSKLPGVESVIGSTRVRREGLLRFLPCPGEERSRRGEGTFLIRSVAGAQRLLPRSRGWMRWRSLPREGREDVRGGGGSSGSEPQEEAW
jgi:hypothetical protein